MRSGRECSKRLRGRRPNCWRKIKAGLALGSGLISLALGSWFAASPGTGNGIVGAWAAMVFGLVALTLGAVALNRSRRVARID
ncbi:DUF6223 family protein [Nocardia sp. NBC_01499]|uniref:DUF6223 family protein n=1 Tax=Nocardia sp. NBC_01499 TaxID=2903597 RepID=UPI00386DEE22